MSWSPKAVLVIVRIKWRKTGIFGGGLGVVGVPQTPIYTAPNDFLIITLYRLV